MIMRNTLKILFVCIVVAMPSLSFAQKVYKFGHVNSQEILATIPDRDSAQTKLQAFAQDLENTLDGMQVEFNKKYQDFITAEPTMNDLVKKTKQEELTQMQQRIQQFQQNAQDEYKNKNDELMQPIIQKIQKAINDVGKENGFLYIFDVSSGAVPYVSADSQDITPIVKTKLNIKK